MQGEKMKEKERRITREKELERRKKQGHSFLWNPFSNIGRKGRGPILGWVSFFPLSLSLFLSLFLPLLTSKERVPRLVVAIPSSSSLWEFSALREGFFSFGFLSHLREEREERERKKREREKEKKLVIFRTDQEPRDCPKQVTVFFFLAFSNSLS